MREKELEIELKSTISGSKISPDKVDRALDPQD